MTYRPLLAILTLVATLVPGLKAESRDFGVPLSTLSMHSSDDSRFIPAIRRVAIHKDAAPIYHCNTQDTSLTYYGCQLYSKPVPDAEVQAVSLRGGISREGMKGSLGVEVVLDW